MPSPSETWPLPAPVLPVRDRGWMTPQGWQPENADWLDVLAPLGRYGREGADPMALPLDVLAAAGHPRRASATAALGAMREPVGSRDDGEPWRFTNLRDHCRGCAENMAEVRRCACIDCPLWPYRMGRNPHNPARGRKPGARSVE